jgi:hypothetical protein
LSNADVNDNIPIHLDDREQYLKNMLSNHNNRLSNSTKDIIHQYLNTFNPNLLTHIKEGIDTDFKNNIDTINNIKNKLNILENMMIEFSIENNSSYIPGGTLFKSLLKIFIVNSFCNILETTKTGSNVMTKMGDIIDITDMLKAGSAAGFTVSFGYIISIIVLLIMGFLNKF